MTILEWIAAFWLVFGIFFYIVGTIGIIRLPDAYSRLHASSKVGTMGLLGILLGVGFMVPASILKLIVLGLFVAISAPVTSHAIAKADIEYTRRQERTRDTSISESGAQRPIQSTPEISTN